MTESSKHKQGRRKAEPARRHKLAGAIPGWRPTPVQVGIAVLVLGVALVLRFALGGGDDAEGSPQKPVGAALKTYGTDWKTKAGDSYRLTVTPYAELSSASAASGCVTAPAAGRTNLRFTVRIDNKGSKPAPVPDVRFAATTKADGTVATGLRFAQASRRIDLVPSSAQTCGDASRITAGGLPEIAAGSATTFTGLVGGVRTPVGPGLALIVRYVQADAAAPSGASEGEVLVKFPDLRALSR